MVFVSALAADALAEAADALAEAALADAEAADADALAADADADAALALPEALAAEPDDELVQAVKASANNAASATMVIVTILFFIIPSLSCFCAISQSCYEFSIRMQITTKREKMHPPCEKKMTSG